MNDIDGFYVITILLTLFSMAVLIFLYGKKNHFQTAKTLFFVIWNIVLSAVLALLVFFVSETYYRFFVDTTDSFSLNKITQRWGKRHYKFNNLKARDNIDYQYGISPGRRRITFVGDSFTAGHGIVDVDDRFANLIRASNPDWEVHVMAANGLETIDELQLIPKLDREMYEFDVLVLVYVLNDISYLIPETEAIYQKIFSFDSKLGYLGRNSYFLNTLYFRWFSKQNADIVGYYDFVKEAYFSTAWEKQKAAFKQLDQYRKQRKWKLIVVTFPFLHNLGENNEFAEVHQNLHAFWQSLAVPHLDLYQEFAKHSNEDLVVNPFDAHPNELAHHIAAKAIERFLKENL